MKPNIFLLGRTSFDIQEALRFLTQEGTTWRRSPSTTGAEELVELSGRVCYMSFGRTQSPRTNAEYIRNLITSGHESVLEHVAWTFLLTGVSRAFTHQLVRHRVGFSFSQLSQQYHDETDAEFVEPDILEHRPELEKVWRDAMSSAHEAYRKILAALEREEAHGNPSVSSKELLRTIRSAARSVLPNATETKIVVTANARALRHFLTVRGAIAGDEEMRRVSAALLSVLNAEAPALFADFRIEALPDDSPIVYRENL